MLWRIFRLFVILIAGLIGLGYVLPDHVRVERQIVINAPAAEVFALVGDLSAWPDWSPWAEADPAMEIKVAGQGPGQRQVWVSADPSVGSGSQIITEYQPPHRVAFALSFSGQGEGRAEMILVEEGGATTLRWAFDSNMRDATPLMMQPLATYFGFFMDGMLGPYYERGLANIKRLAEAS